MPGFIPNAIRAVSGGTSVLSSIGNVLLPKIIDAGARKVDQFLGLDSDNNNPQAIATQQGNMQNTIETVNSGSDLPDRLRSDYYVSDRQQAQLANIIPFAGGAVNAVSKIGQAVTPFIKRNIGNITGAIGGGAMLSTLYDEQGLCNPNRGGQPFSVSKTTGCISVSRKQQRMLKELVMTMGMEGASDATGLNPSQLGLLIVKKFPPRSRGITGASMKTTRRTIRQLTRYAEDLDAFCKRPTPRKRRK